MDKRYKKLSLDFPVEEYTKLKMACAKQGVSLKDFVTKASLDSMEEYENELTIQQVEQEKDFDKASKKVFRKYGKMFSRLSNK